MNRIKYFWINSFVVILFLIDIYLKKIFSTSSREYFIFYDWFKLKHAFNSGIAFGININFYLIILFYLIAIPILIWFLVFQYKQKKSLNILAVTLVIFGAISNLIDRVLFGGVIDYFDVKYWSVFNLADTMIVIGVTILIVLSLKDKK
jgi:signal peptidase II